MWIILTVLVGIAGGTLARKMKLPGGMLLGSLIFVALLNLITGKAFLWQESKIFAQILAGAYAGCMLERKAVHNLPRVLGPYLFILGNFAVLNLVVGYVIYCITDMDLLTSFFCSLPGGVNDAPLIAMDMGANAVPVTTLQVVRLLFGIGCLPSIIVLYNGKTRASASKEREKILAEHKEKQKNASIIRFIPTLLVALAAGIIGRMSGIPAGTMSFALIAVGALKYREKAPQMPVSLHRVTQVITGCCIGSTLTVDALAQMKQLAVPAVILCAAYLLYCIVGGIVLHRRFKMDQTVAMLALSPAGALEMTLIAADLGIESTELIALQMGRFIGVLLLMPQLYTIVLNCL